MGPEAWFTVGTIALVIVALMTDRMSVDVAMVGGLTMLMAGDFVMGFLWNAHVWTEFPRAITGFAHPAIFIIGSLFVVAAGLQETGGMEKIAQRLLGRPKTVWAAQFRLMMPNWSRCWGIPKSLQSSKRSA